MFITKKHLSRRTVLRGLGCTVSLPLLDAMIPAATALANTAAAPKPRLGFFYFPHGAIMEKWTPATDGRDFKISPILEPLQPFQKYLTVVSNIGNKPGESRAVHALVPATWLSCVHPKQGQEPHMAPTCDQIAALAIGQDTPLPSLEIATEGQGGGGSCDRDYGCNYSGTISFRSASTPLPMEYNPRKLFQRLFGRGDSPEERKALVGQYSSVLDMVAEDAASLQAKLGPRDKAMLADYMETVRELERRMEKIEAQDLSKLKLPQVPVGIPDNFDQHLNLMFDMAALAYQGNLTRIQSFMLAPEVSEQTYNHIGVPDAFHALSHHANDEAKKDRHDSVHLFPSSVDRTHFAKARRALPEPAEQARLPRPRLGFYGVLDERFDTELLDAIAQMRPGWQFVMVGPVVKISEDELPRRPNIHYPGARKYEQLPAYLSGWDVALMPFAMNESTRFISPTKTPEYLAGGKPVVSTPVRDVVRHYGHLESVGIASGPEEFVAACERMLELPADGDWLAEADLLLSATSWATTQARMSALVAEALGERQESESSALLVAAE